MRSYYQSINFWNGSKLVYNILLLLMALPIPFKKAYSLSASFLKLSFNQSSYYNRLQACIIDLNNPVLNKYRVIIMDRLLYINLYNHWSNWTQSTILLLIPFESLTHRSFGYMIFRVKRFHLVKDFKRIKWPKFS